MPKRLLVVSQHYWPENFRSTDLCEAFAARGIEVDVLCGLPNYPKGEFFEGYGFFGPMEEERGGVHIYRCKEIPRKNNTSLRIFLNYISFPFFARLSLRRLKKKRYDAILSYETSPVMMAYPALALAKKSGVPCTIYVLDLWPENFYSVIPVQNAFLRSILKKVSDWHYRSADQLVALSEESRAHLLQVTGKPPETVRVLPQYCEDFYALHPAPTAEVAAFFKKVPLTVLFAGNISPAQSLETLVQAAALAQLEAPGAIQYVLVGDGMSRAKLEAYCHEKGVAPLFTFVGQRPAADIPLFQSAADVFFIGLSKSDMLGFTIPAKFSSYCAGAKPILAALDGAGATLVKESGCGLASPAQDAAALEKNLLALLHLSEEERAEMGKAGFACYEKNFSRDILLDRLEHFLF